jgi:hypothetical protein
MKQTTYLLLAAMLFSIVIRAQEVNIPDSLEFATNEDYKKYEPTILKFIDWLEETPVDSMKMKRVMVQAIINEWGQETPYLVFYPFTKVSNPIFKEMKEEYGREIFMAYYGGMIKYMLENPQEKDLVKVQLAGINHLLEFASKNAMELGSSEAIATYKELSYSGNLKNWINKKLLKKEKRGLMKFKPGEDPQDTH